MKSGGQCRREGGGGGGGGGKGVHYPGPRGTKGAPRSLRIIFFFPIVCDDPFVFDRAQNFSLTASLPLLICTAHTWEKKFVVENLLYFNC